MFGKLIEKERDQQTKRNTGVKERDYCEDRQKDRHTDRYAHLKTDSQAVLTSDRQLFKLTSKCWSYT